MKSITQLATPVVLVLVMAGCRSRHNFSHIQISNFESPNIRADPGATLSQHSTFAIVPIDEQEDKLTEKQVLYLVASALGGRGYEHVDINLHPDFLLTVGFSNEYKSTNVPPATYSIPIYNPGQTYTTNTNAYVYSPYGNLYGTAQSYTTTPGYWSSQSYTRPGYTVGWYFPSVSVALWDADSNEQIWSGSNVGSSQTKNFGMTAPFVLSSIASRIPLNTNSTFISGMLTGSLGVINAFGMNMSRDGSMYYPTIVYIPKGSSAKKSGLKVWDMVIEINGRPTANIRVKDLIDLCTGAIGETVALTVVRMDKVFNVEVQLERLSDETRRALH